MQQPQRVSSILGTLAALAILMSAGLNPVAAQSIEEIERLAASSETVEGGLTLARTQVASGAMLEALATLDRTLARDPKNRQARLLHANVLCLIDDRVGASVEFARLREKDYPKAQWSAAMAACSSPGQAPGRRR